MNSRFVVATDWSSSTLKLHIDTHEFEIVITKHWNSAVTSFLFKFLTLEFDRNIFFSLELQIPIKVCDNLQTLRIWLAPGFKPYTSLMKTSALPLWAIQTTHVRVRLVSDLKARLSDMMLDISNALFLRSWKSFGELLIFVLLHSFLMVDYHNSNHEQKEQNQYCVFNFLVSLVQSLSFYGKENLPLNPKTDTLQLFFCSSEGHMWLRLLASKRLRTYVHRRLHKVHLHCLLAWSAPRQLLGAAIYKQFLINL